FVPYANVYTFDEHNKSFVSLMVDDCGGVFTLACSGHLGLSGMGKGMQAGEKGEVGQTNGQELAGVGNVFSGFESGLGMEMVGGMFGPGGRSWLSMGTGGLWESKNNKVQVC
ncbi:unnamed protein product, partial [Ilex paraguariensis]